LFLDFFLRRAFKTFKSERRFEDADGSDFQEENSNLYGGTFKNLYPPTLPLERESLAVGLTILKLFFLSILKMKL